MFGLDGDAADLNKQLNVTGENMNISRRTFLRGTCVTTAGLSLGQCAVATGRKKRPVNLLFIMTDQQRWDALSCAGNENIDTPNIDRLAREGAYFENAMSGCPVCVPARSIMLTGHSTENTGVRRNADRKSGVLVPVPTFDNILAENGYTTEYYGKWHTPHHLTSTYANKVRPVVGKTTESGVQSFSSAYVEYLREHVSERPLEPGEILERAGHIPYVPDPIDLRYGMDPEDVPKRKNGRPDVPQGSQHGCSNIPAEFDKTAFCAKETLEAFDRIKGGPFSLTCSFGPPHPPLIVPEPYYGMYPHDEIPVPKSIHDQMDNSPYRARSRGENMARYKDVNTIGYMISEYYGMVKEVDDWVGRLLDALDEAGLAESTLVIFTSDHGEMLGDHGMHSKMNFYEGSVHVPLLMRLPGIIPAGTVVSTPVSQIDYFATILDYLDMPFHESDGRSLRGLIDGDDADGADYCVSEWHSDNTPNLMVRTEKWKLLMANRKDSSALDALYNLEDDPLEINNLIGNNPNKDRYMKYAQAMKDRLVEWLEKTGSPYTEEVVARAL